MADGPQDRQRFRQQANDSEWLIARAGTLLCALPVTSVREISRPLPIDRLAGLPESVLGTTLLRGNLTPVIELSCLLGGECAIAHSPSTSASSISPSDLRSPMMKPDSSSRESKSGSVIPRPSRATHPKRRFITLKVSDPSNDPAGEPSADRRVALLVDEVMGVRSLGSSERKALPPLLSDVADAPISTLARLDDALVLVLSTFRLLPDAEDVWRAIEQSESEDQENDSQTRGRESEARNRDSEARNRDSEARNRDSEARNRDSEARNRDSEARGRDFETRERGFEAPDRGSETRDRESDAQDRKPERRKRESKGGNE